MRNLKLSSHRKNSRPSHSDEYGRVAREMYKQNLELAERNKTLMLLRRIDEIVLSSSGSTMEVAQQITELLVNEAGFSLAMIYVADESRSFVSTHGVSAGSKTPAVKAFLKTHLDKVSLHTHKNVFFEAISTGKIQLAVDFKEFKPNISDEEDEFVREQSSISTLLVCPMLASKSLIGVLVLGMPLKKADITPYQHNLAERLSSTVAIATENHLLYEEIQAANQKVKAQNRRLKQLDESKNEFISMASHQLRTPLTAIKGYLSMVLEGDGGRVSKKEKDMIQTAFDSAERMVSLIADLLNISRLQSGKFVIENNPTNLAKMVETEVKQLQESADHHGLKLKFKKPTNFPTLMLDEGKIRQVLMNFLDNAIYYTPAGGAITVELKADDKEVRYTVTDTGLGVPKADQAHLFGKFYRANNAKKARPDGTGLGLYMAKKVVVAQGGSIIFNSVEGQGSTFGFSFPRSAVEK